MNRSLTCLLGLWLCATWLHAQIPAVHLSGCVFHDLNFNHQWDAGEPTLPGWEVLFTDLTAGTSQIVITDSTGCYDIELMPDPAGAPHAVVLLLNVMPGYDQTYPLAGGYSLTVVGGQDVGALDFGVVLTVPPTATLHICKWEDRNCNGHWDDDEDGLANWPFRIVNTATNEEIIVHTEAGGCVNAEVPAPATYRVEEAQNGDYYVPTWPVDPPWYEVVAVPNGFYEGLVFGNNIPTWVFTACAFHDLDCDGVWDLGEEPPLPDWPITQTTICPGNPNVVAVTNLETGPSGCATSEGAWACSHTFAAQSMPGWTFSTDSVVVIGPADSLFCATPTDRHLVFGLCQLPIDTCGAIVEEELGVDTCSDAGLVVQYKFMLTNYSSQPVTSFLLTGLPAGVSASPQYFSSNNFPGLFPIPPGATAGPFTTTLTLAAPAQGELCFRFILITDGEECCHFDHCVEVPFDDCASLDIGIVAVPPSGTNTGAIQDDCCYEVRPVNNSCYPSLSAVEVVVDEPGVVISSYQGTPDWTLTLLAPDRLRAYWNGGTMPQGALPPFTFCLDTDQHGGGPVTIISKWVAGGPDSDVHLLFCPDSTEVECSDCAIVTGADQVVCNDDGTWTLPHLCVHNQSGESPSVVLFEVQTPGITLVPDMVPWTGNPTCSSLILSGGNAGDVVTIKVLLLDEASGWCCHVLVDVVLDCAQPCIDSTLINLDIACPAIYDPVCGCDGVTYPNACAAVNWHGVTSWTPGPCPQDCVDSSLIMPTGVCPDIYDPVCGCNGVTYMNECAATIWGGVTHWTPGPCPIPGCLDPTQINPDVVCPAVYDPVCGCDGVTYDNACQAVNWYGVLEWTPGPCPDTQPAQPHDTLTAIPILLRPNPVSDKLYVDMPEGAYQLRVLSAEGRLVAHLQVQAEPLSPPSIDVSHLPQGLYLLQVTDAEGRMGTARFVRVE